MRFNLKYRAVTALKSRSRVTRKLVTLAARGPNPPGRQAAGESAARRRLGPARPGGGGGRDRGSEGNGPGPPGGPSDGPRRRAAAHWPEARPRGLAPGPGPGAATDRDIQVTDSEFVLAGLILSQAAQTSRSMRSDDSLAVTIASD
jgi:hypothetical protein